MDQTITPSTINKLRDAAPLSFAMLAGMQLDLFPLLDNGPMSLEELAQALDVRPLKLRPLACALAAAGLLEFESERFSNTPESSKFLVKGTPTYVEGMHETLTSAWEATLKTAESIAPAFRRPSSSSRTDWSMSWSPFFGYYTARR